MTTRRRRTGRWMAAALMTLMLAFMIGAISGCAGGSGKSQKPDITDNSNGGGTVVPDKPDDGGSGSVDGNGNGGSVEPDPPGDGGSGAVDGSGSGGSVEPDQPGDGGSGSVDGSGNGGSVEPDQPGDGGVKAPDIVAENKAFRLFEPAEDAVVGTSFTVRGEARVFEAAFSYSFEDGHNVLAEGHVMADMGAPEWGKFEFTVTFEEATSPFGILTIYESSAMDGSPVNELQIPVKFANEAMQQDEDVE